MKRSILTIGLLVALTLPVEAASYNCGRYLKGVYGYVDRALDLSLNWARRFPHTSARPGAVVVQRRKGRALGGGPGGHVAKILEIKQPCRAVVQDNRGRYERDICKNLVAYVQP